MSAKRFQWSWRVIDMRTGTVSESMGESSDIADLTSAVSGTLALVTEQIEIAMERERQDEEVIHAQVD